MTELNELNEIIPVWRQVFRRQMKEAAGMIGVSVPHMKRIESGQNRLSMAHLSVLADESNCSLNRLLFAYMTMDCNVERIADDTEDPADLFVRALYDVLSIHRRKHEANSISRHVMDSPRALSEALAAAADGPSGAGSERETRPKMLKNTA